MVNFSVPGPEFLIQPSLPHVDSMTLTAVAVAVCDRTEHGAIDAGATFAADAETMLNKRIAVILKMMASLIFDIDSTRRNIGDGKTIVVSTTVLRQSKRHAQACRRDIGEYLRLERVGVDETKGATR